MLVTPACFLTRSSSASQRSLKVWIGFTGTANSCAPATVRVLGVEPMLIDNWSYGTGGRFLQITLRAARSSAIASSRKKRAPANTASRLKSMCTSS